MAEIFKEAQGFDNHPDRWNHDLSHKSYGSFKAGIIYPVFTHLMCPTDTVKLDAASLLQFMPTPTPLQSNVRVIFHAFFQRLKNIYEDWPNTIEQLEEHDLPYVLPSVKEFIPGSIHDFLDVPCCVVVNSQQSVKQLYSFSYDLPWTGKITTVNSLGKIITQHDVPCTFVSDVSNGYGLSIQDFGTKVVPSVDPSYSYSESCTMRLSQYPFAVSTGSSTQELPFVPKVRVSLGEFGFYRDASAPFVLIDAVHSGEIDEEPYLLTFSRYNLLFALSTLGYESGDVIHLDPCWFWFSQSGPVTIETFADLWVNNRVSYDVLKGDSYNDYYVYGSYSYSDFPLLCPYATKEFPDRPIRLRAFRYRTYESNYNAFYRNIHGNQPFVVDGVTRYNQYNTTKASGQDDTQYHLFCRNWELDAYTSCLPSPQQGNVPYVGVSALGNLVIQDDDGTRSTAKLTDLPDNQKGLAISNINAANDEHRNIMMRLAESGFTINDFRETNALQRFLETNIRKGFRYIDFVKGHFGSAPKHAEMDMPEFLGGFTVKLDVGKVVNTNAGATATNPNDVLGQFAGSAQAFGTSKYPIQYFADDYGYVQVTMCIVPDAAYSQILPKDFLYSSPLDFPFPEFSNLGYQPITYEEFCPGEAYKDFLDDNSKKLTDVFGYQRPQHERVWLPDRIHGQFLTTMNNYVVNRVFEHRPELGNDFLQIDPGEMTRNFTVTKADEDIAFGQIGFNIVYKQPVPRVSIPRLGL